MRNIDFYREEIKKIKSYNFSTMPLINKYWFKIIEISTEGNLSALYFACIKKCKTSAAKQYFGDLFLKLADTNKWTITDNVMSHINLMNTSNRKENSIINKRIIELDSKIESLNAKLNKIEKADKKKRKKISKEKKRIKLENRLEEIASRFKKIQSKTTNKKTSSISNRKKKLGGDSNAITTRSSIWTVKKR